MNYTHTPPTHNIKFNWRQLILVVNKFSGISGLSAPSKIKKKIGLAPVSFIYKG